MRTVLKIVLALLVLVAILIGGGFAYVASLDFNQYRGLIAAKVKEATGRELAIRGNIAPQFGWTPVLAVEGVSLANAPWGEKRPMVDIGRFEAQLQLWPLVTSLGKQVIVDRIVLKGADILLETDEKGLGNWKFDSGAPAGATSRQQAPASGGAAAIEVDVRDVEFRDVKLGFKPGKATPMVLAVESLTMKGEGETGPRKIEGAGSYNKLKFTLAGQVGPMARLIKGPFPVDLSVRLGDRGLVRVAGEIREPIAAKDYAFNITSELRELGLIADIASEAGFPPPPVPALGPFKAEIAVNDKGPGGQPSWPSLKVALGTPDMLRLGVDGAVRDPFALLRTPMAAPGANLSLVGEANDLAKLAQKLGAAAPIDGPFKLTGRLADQGLDKLALTGFKLEAAGSDIGGDASLALGKKPTIVGAFTANRLDLAKFAGGAAPASAPRGGRVFPDDPLPLDGLAAVDAEIKLAAATIVLPNKMEARGVDVALVLKGGDLDVKPLKLGIGGGTVEGSISVKDEGALTTQLAMRGIDLGTVLRQTQGLSQLNGGRTNADVNVRGTGRSVRQLMAGLSGNVSVHVGGGSIRSDYLDKLGLEELMALINKSMAPEENVRLNCVVSRIDIAGGMATHRTLVVDTARLTLIGGGRTNLASEALDMRADTRTKVTTLLSVLPPILVKGSLGHPRFEPDLAGAAAGVAGAIINAPGSVAGAAGNVAGGILGAVTGQSAGSGASSGGGDVCGAALSGRPLPGSGSTPAPRSGQPPAAPGGIPVPQLPNPFRR